MSGIQTPFEYTNPVNEQNLSMPILQKILSSNKIKYWGNKNKIKQNNWGAGCAICKVSDMNTLVDSL